MTKTDLSLGVQPEAFFLADYHNDTITKMNRIGDHRMLVVHTNIQDLGNNTMTGEKPKETK